MAHLPLREPDADLIPLLRQASSDDLSVLIEYLHKDPNEDLSKVPAFKEQNPDAKNKIYDGDHSTYADDISAEIQRYGGNTFANIFRGGKGVPYVEVVRNVADHLNVNYNANADAANIEAQIQLKVLEKAYEHMTEEERTKLLNELGYNVGGGIPKALPMAAVQGAIKLGGFAAYKMALIVANAVARALIGRGLSFAANRTLTQAMGVFAGPVGWALTAAWTLADLAGPAYRVSIPCVVHIAYIRQKTLVALCPHCEEPQSTKAKFCQSCGGAL